MLIDSHDCIAGYNTEELIVSIFAWSLWCGRLDACTDTADIQTTNVQRREQMPRST